MCKNVFITFIFDGLTCFCLGAALKAGGELIFGVVKVVPWSAWTVMAEDGRTLCLLWPLADWLIGCFMFRSYNSLSQHPVMLSTTLRAVGLQVSTSAEIICSSDIVFSFAVVHAGWNHRFSESVSSHHSFQAGSLRTASSKWHFGAKSLLNGVYYGQYLEEHQRASSVNTMWIMHYRHALEVSVLSAANKGQGLAFVQAVKICCYFSSFSWSQKRASNITSKDKTPWTCV